VGESQVPVTGGVAVEEEFGAEVVQEPDQHLAGGPMIRVARP
jgi:hypothetical protein